jgi:UrcA family protein
MTNITHTIASVATLFLAAIPALALSGAAHAAPAHHAVQIGDLNLASASGQRALAQRTEQVAADMCNASGVERLSLSAIQSCKVAIRAEVAEKAAAVHQTQMAVR